jgi:hypothetical protein
MTRQQKIAFAEMRATGVRNVLIFCSDHRCGHFNIVPDDADHWADELRISDIEDKFVCTACSVCGAAGSPTRSRSQAASQRLRKTDEPFRSANFSGVMLFRKLRRIGVCPTAPGRVVALREAGFARLTVRVFPEE